MRRPSSPALLCGVDLDGAPRGVRPKQLLSHVGGRRVGCCVKLQRQSTNTVPSLATRHEGLIEPS
jgi:hypothetical protein